MMVLLGTLLLAGCGSGGLTGAGPGTTATGGGAATTGPATDDAQFAQAFADRAQDVSVQGRGTVVRLLDDDTSGDRHQRFIVGLASGQTLLISHNIDVAPRVASLKVGDVVVFKGEYVWNEQGGIVHWTHHDPDGSHEGGWIEHEGRRYE